MFIFLSTCCTIILFYSAYSKFKNCNFIKQSRCVNTKITGDRNVKKLVPGNQKEKHKNT